MERYSSDYKFYNENPTGRSVGDCAVRAVSIALGVDWETAYALMAVAGFNMGDMPSSNSGWGGFGDFGGMGGFGGAMWDFPWLINGQQGINNNVSDGFRDAQLHDSVTSVRDGVSNLATQLCNCCGDMQMSIANSTAGIQNSLCSGMRCGKSWTSCYLSRRQQTRACLMALCVKLKRFSLQGRAGEIRLFLFIKFCEKM